MLYNNPSKKNNYIHIKISFHLLLSHTDYVFIQKTYNSHRGSHYTAHIQKNKRFTAEYKYVQHI